MKALIIIALVILAIIGSGIYYDYTVYTACHQTMPWWFCLKLIGM